MVITFSFYYRPFLLLSRVASLALALGFAWIGLASSLARGDLPHSYASLAHYLYHYLLYLVWKFVLLISLIVFLALFTCLGVSSCPVQHLCFHPWNSEMTVLHGSSSISLFYSETVDIRAGYCSSRSQQLFGRSQHHSASLQRLLPARLTFQSVVMSDESMMRLRIKLQPAFLCSDAISSQIGA